MNDYYVYLYLTNNLSPYYVGMGRGDRCYRHCNSYDAPTPDRALIIILKDNLSQVDAWLREEIFILMYGRKCDGGILVNKSRGGKGWGGGCPATEERKQKIADANRGRILTDEHKLKLSLAKKGKKQSHTAVANRARNVSRAITVRSPEGTVITFSSGKECAKCLGVDQSTISHLRRGKTHSCKGYTLT